jgi:hypothetical protein
LYPTNTKHLFLFLISLIFWARKRPKATTQDLLCHKLSQVCLNFSSMLTKVYDRIFLRVFLAVLLK